MAKVSIIVPVYNCEKYIADAINSILSQTYYDYEIIVVDDGSVDRTKEVLNEYSDNRLRYFYKENGGLSSARNYGMTQASGDYIAFLDADDVWYPTKIEDQFRLLAEYKDFGIVSCNVQYVDELGHGKEFFNMRRLYPKDGFNLDNLLTHSFLIPSSVMIRKKVIDDVGWFKSDFDGAEDIECFLRVLTKYPLGLVDKVLLKYRIGHPSLSSGCRSYRVRERVFDEFFRKTSDSKCSKLSLYRNNAYYGLYHSHGKNLLWLGRTSEARQYFLKALRYKRTGGIIFLYFKSCIKDMLMMLGNLRKSTKGN